jgi:hypothetical protein
MANKRGTAAGVAGHNKVADSVHVHGVYRQVLRQVCRQEIADTRYPYRGLRDLHDPQRLVEESQITTLADGLFDERVGLGEPVVAWWYQLPKNLPPPLDVVGRADGPRHARVTADDRVELLAARPLRRA